MKKISKIFIATVLAMVAISCAKEELNIDKVPVTMVKQTLYAYTDDGLVSKTQLAGLNVVWNENDAITAFDANGNGYNATVEKSEVVDEGKEGTMGKFTFEVPEGTTLKTAVYPAGENYTYEDGCICAELPSVQTAVKGNFADGVNLALANVPSDLAKPFKFSNATGLLCLGVNAEEDALSNLVGIQLYAKENSGEHIAGGVMAELADNKVTCVSDAEDGFEVRNIISLNADSFGQGDYYFCALPGNYGGVANKMKITFFRKDGKVATYANPNELTLGVNENILIGRLNIPATKWQDNLVLDLSIDETSTANDDEISWDNPLVNLSTTKGTSTNANKYYPGTPNQNYTSTRFYAGSTLTITPKGNISIAKIEFSATTDGYANAIGDATIWANASVKSNVDKLVTIVPTVGTNNLIANIGATCGFDKITIYFGQPEEKHTITLEDVENGTISASSETAFAGEIITLNAIPAQGYEHDTWVVKCGNDDVTVENSKFTMPDGDVTVSATFKERTTPQPQGEDEVFYESFDNNDGKGANDGNGWSGSIASNTIKSINEGWVFTKGNGAYQCAKFGTGSAQGSAETPEIDFKGAEEATLTFKAGLWSGDTNKGLKISATNASVSPASVTLEDGKWSNYEIAISEVKGKVKIKFAASSATKNRFFLDEVRVVTKPTKILNSIAISGDPSQKEYFAGESFNPAGLIVTGTYSDNSTAKITDGIVWTFSPDPLTSGTTSVTVTAKVGTITSEPYTVNGLTVESVVSVESVSIDESEINLTEKETATLTATIAPTGATNQKISWSSSSTSVATVVAGENNTAKVTAIAGGTATITVTTDDGGKTATCTVKVTALPRYKVTVESPTGGTITALPNENILAGTEISLTQTASKGYEFTEWNVTDNNGSVTVTDNKFTMPASDVTVSATFSVITPYTTITDLFAAATTTAQDVNVTFNEWIVTGVTSYSAYVTDGTYGFILNESGYAIGDKLSGTAIGCSLKLYYGAAQLSNVSELTKTSGATVEPASIPLTDLTAKNTGAFIQFNNMTYNEDVFTDGTNTIAPYDTFNVKYALENGVKYNIKGVFVWYNGKKEIAPVAAADFQEIEAQKYNITTDNNIQNGTITPSLSQASEGQEVTITVTPDPNYELATLTYTPEGGNPVAIENNIFTMPAANVVVSATFAYNPVEITPGIYTINLNNTFYGCSTGNNATEQSKEINNITVVSGCKSGAQNSTYYDSKHIRYYVDSYLKFSVPTSAEITKIEFAEPESDKKYSENGVSASSGTYSNKIWTGRTSSVQFSFTAQCRFASVKVTIVKAGEDPEKETPVITVEDNFEVEIGKSASKSVTVTSGYDGNLSASSDNANVTASISNGTLTVSASANASENETATITITAPETANFKSTTKTVTVTVVAASQGGNPQTETLNIGDYASANNWVNSNAYKEAKTDNVTFTGSGTGNNCKYYSSDKSWRFYSSGNGKITITVPTGKKITEVKLTGTSYFKSAPSGWTYSDNTFTPEANTTTNSVTISNGNDTSKITTIAVTFQ